MLCIHSKSHLYTKKETNKKGKSHRWLRESQWLVLAAAIYYSDIVELNDPCLTGWETLAFLQCFFGRQPHVKCTQNLFFVNLLPSCFIQPFLFCLHLAELQYGWGYPWNCAWEFELTRAWTMLGFQSRHEKVCQFAHYNQGNSWGCWAETDLY